MGVSVLRGQGVGLPTVKVSFWPGVRTRIDYLDGKLTAEEFLRKIDTMHDLEDYTVNEVVAPPADTAWQQLVAGSIGFDPATHYPKTFMQLDLGADDPQWQTCSADDLRRQDQAGHQSLREKYGKK